MDVKALSLPSPLISAFYFFFPSLNVLTTEWPGLGLAPARMTAGTRLHQSPRGPWTHALGRSSAVLEAPVAPRQHEHSNGHPVQQQRQPLQYTPTLYSTSGTPRMQQTPGTKWEVPAAKRLAGTLRGCWVTPRALSGPIQGL